MDPSDCQTLPLLNKSNLVFDIGVKCNTQAIRRRLGIAAYSSPFDNMDSVHGLRDIARLLSHERSNYFSASDKWIIRNDYASRSSTVRAKVIYHPDFPGLFYPHFHAGWFSNVSSSELVEWQSSPECSLDLVWNGFSSTFGRRLDRLKCLLKEGRQICFLRIDEARSIQRIYAQGNTQHDVDYFVQSLVDQGLANFRLIYLYGKSSQYNRSILSSDLVTAIPIRIDEEYDELVDNALKALFNLD